MIKLKGGAEDCVKLGFVCGEATNSVSPTPPRASKALRMIGTKQGISTPFRLKEEDYLDPWINDVLGANSPQFSYFSFSHSVLL